MVGMGMLRDSDLIPMDFWFSDYQKLKGNRSNLRDLSDIKYATKHKINSITLCCQQSPAFRVLLSANLPSNLLIAIKVLSSPFLCYHQPLTMHFSFYVLSRKFQSHMDRHLCVITSQMSLRWYKMNVVGRFGGYFTILPF